MVVGGPGDGHNGIVPAGFKGGERDQFLTLLNLTNPTDTATVNTPKTEIDFSNLPKQVPAGFKGGEREQFLNPGKDDNQ